MDVYYKDLWISRLSSMSLIDDYILFTCISGQIVYVCMYARVGD